MASTVEPSTEALRILAKQYPQLSVYLDVPDIQEGLDYGRILASQWGTIMLHLTEIRRDIVRSGSLPYHMIDNKAFDKLHKAKLGQDTYTNAVLMVALTLAEVTGHKTLYNELRAIL